MGEKKVGPANCRKHGTTSCIGGTGLSYYVECPLCRMEKAESFVRAVQDLAWEVVRGNVDTVYPNSPLFKSISELLEIYRNDGEFAVGVTKERSGSDMFQDLLAAGKMEKLGHGEIAKRVIIGRKYVLGGNEAYSVREDTIMRHDGEKFEVSRCLVPREPLALVQPDDITSTHLYYNSGVASKEGEGSETSDNED